MKAEGRLMSMLTGYAASHQHPFNIFVHMIGIPTIMLGVLIPLTWIGFEINDFHFYLAHVVLAGFVLFYLTLDVIFAIVFAVGAYFLTALAVKLGSYPGNTGWIIAAACFFTVVELFKLAGLRDELFDAVQNQIAKQRAAQPSE